MSYLDHPPLVAWSIRLGTLLFGDTNFGVRFAGMLSMLAMQLLLAESSGAWCAIPICAGRGAVAGSLPHFRAWHGQDHAGYRADPLRARDDVVAGPVVAVGRSTLVARGRPVRRACAGLEIHRAAAVARGGAVRAGSGLARAAAPQSASLARSVLALLVFSPVLVWNATHDWASFRFQLDRPAQLSGWSLKFFGDFVGQQFVLIGVLMLPVIIWGTAMLATRGFRRREPVAILLSSAVIFPLLCPVRHSLSARVGDSWPLFIWPLAFACTAISYKQWREESQSRPARISFATSSSRSREGSPLSRPRRFII